ncbi:MAG: hypothetical protein Q9219_004435 [cf. Caloplaca sp. 3 TL-2023]
MVTTRLKPNTYLARIPLDHCYSKTAHGGFLISVVLNALQQYYKSALIDRTYPDTSSIDAFFLHPAEAGEATVVIKNVKNGAKVTIVHFALVQGDIEKVVGYAANMDINAERGVTHPVAPLLDPQPPSANLEKLAEGSDPEWIGFSVPWHPKSFLKAIAHYQFFSPIKTLSPTHMTDTWMRFAAQDQRFTTEMLGTVADHWRRMIENYVPASAWSQEMLLWRAEQATRQRKAFVAYPTSYGYPTLSMHLEVKKKLPAAGSEWLFMRARANTIKNGRFDADVMIMDEGMELVAISHQIAFIIDSTQEPDHSKELEKSQL